MIRARFVVVLAALFACAAPAGAQVNIAGYNVQAYSQEKLGENHWQLSGAVELERGDSSIYADSIEFFEAEERAVARGNVVVSQGDNRIAADVADFNTRTQFGTFYRASGIARVRPPRQAPAAGGIAVPPPTTQENEIYFFGEMVEKIGAKRYRITKGGFSTCVQPTPRWDLTAGTIVLNIDDYTLLRQVLLNVKGVPLLYLPFFYYPTKEDERATGFLIPTYGASSLRGQTIHNAFFWAIDRSQDATVLLDWYSKTGLGTGGEYRYNRGGGSEGYANAYILDQKPTPYVQEDGSTVTTPGSRSYMLKGMANQVLPNRFRAQAQMDYFSSIYTNQTFHTNVTDASQNQRSYAANVMGLTRGVMVNASFDRREWFNTTTTSGVVGNAPRLLVARSERPIMRGSAVYFGVTGDYTQLVRQTRFNDVVIDDKGLGRIDFAPQLRYPFKRWPFLTVNTTLAWRETFYTRSLNPLTEAVVSDDINRQYFTVQAQAVGPVFTRVWNTPNNGYAERFKHTIEPYFNIQRTSPIDAFERIVKIDPIDSVVGSTTSYAYGLNNRFYAKRRIVAGRTAIAQEIMAFEINQSYYTDARASQYDSRYATSNTAAPNNFSPIALILRATPGASFNVNMRAEIDSRYLALRTVSTSGTMNWRQQLLATVGWSHRFFIEGLNGFDDARNLDHYLNVQSNVQTRDRKYGAIYSMNYDIQRGTMLQQRISGFYNAQCCGIAAEYQRYNFAGVPSYVVPADNRFFLSFTLAGLGNFSPFSGGLGGVPR
jgi:LPS-assembly protein